MADSLPALHTALQQIWKKNLPQTRDRLSLLARATAQLRAEGVIAPDLRSEAHSTAHKLAGSLGMFGHNDATEHARAIEQLLQAGSHPDPETVEHHLRGLYSTLEEALAD